MFKNWKLLFKNFYGNTCRWKSMWKYVKYCLETENRCLETLTKHPLTFVIKDSKGIKYITCYQTRLIPLVGPITRESIPNSTQMDHFYPIDFSFFSKITFIRTLTVVKLNSYIAILVSPKHNNSYYSELKVKFLPSLLQCTIMYGCTL